MDESVLLRILPVMINNYLDLVDHEWTEEQRKDLSIDIAQVAWNGLVALLRQALAGGDEITLAEFGTFNRTTTGDWTFIAAASLEETSALRLPFKEGQERIADRLLFHLDAAIDLIKTLAFDVTQPPPVAVTEKFPWATDEVKLSFVMKRFYLHQLQIQVQKLETKPHPSEHQEKQVKKNETRMLEAELAWEAKRKHEQKRQAARPPIRGEV